MRELEQPVLREPSVISQWGTAGAPTILFDFMGVMGETFTLVWTPRTHPPCCELAVTGC